MYTASNTTERQAACEPQANVAGVSLLIAVPATDDIGTSGAP